LALSSGKHLNFQQSNKTTAGFIGLIFRFCSTETKRQLQPQTHSLGALNTPKMHLLSSAESQ